MGNRLPSIDALRGFAAIWVAAYHLWNAFAPGCSPQTEPIPISHDTPSAILASFPIFAYGYVGVGLFFVLSGFCIHLPQARRFHVKQQNTLDNREFFRRRFWRLYPAFLGSLLLSCIALAAMNIAWANPPSDTIFSMRYLLEASGAGYVLTNMLFLLPVQPSALAVNGVYWTLVYEVQFYLAYPILLKCCRRFGFARIGAILLLIELAFIYVPAPSSLESWKPHFLWFFLRRYFEWFLGMWLAERFAAGKIFSRQQAAMMLFAAAGSGIAASGFAISWPIHEIFFAVGSTAFLAWAIAPSVAPTGSITHLFAWLGDFSYSIYLVHLPVYRLAFAIETQLPHRSFWTFAASGAIAFIMVIVIARLLYLWLEKPYLPSSSTQPVPQHKPALVMT